jgi:hypothetical protein
VIGLPKKIHFDQTSNNNGITQNYYRTYEMNNGGLGIFIFPKYHFKTIGQNSLSVGSPSTIAFSGGGNSQTGS